MTQTQPGQGAKPGTSFLDRLAVAFVIFLITVVPFTSQYIVLIPWLNFHPRLRYERLALLIPYNLAILSIWINYYLACTTPPGCIPHGYEGPSPKDGGGNSVKRYCRKCNAFKPPRTHHCSVCKTCVLRMDHHCPWLNNCVGFYNQGYFIRFISSVGFAASYCLGLFGLYMRHLILSQSQSLYSYKNFDRFYSPPPNSLTLVVMILDAVVLFILVLTVGLLALWQLYYAASNTTTIEALENEKIDKLIKRGIIRSATQYPYDLGSSLANLKSMLGRNMLLWWIPFRQEGNGIEFPMHKDLMEEAERTGDFDMLVWPPQEYYDYKEGRLAVPERDSYIRSTTPRLVESSDEDDGFSSDSSGYGGGYSQSKGQESGIHQNDIQGRRRIVRRGSEGYLVRESTSYAYPTQQPEGEGDIDDDDDTPLIALKRE